MFHETTVSYPLFFAYSICAQGKFIMRIEPVVIKFYIYLAEYILAEVSALCMQQLQKTNVQTSYPEILPGWCWW